jgi:hypothetical protein
MQKPAKRDPKPTAPDRARLNCLNRVFCCWSSGSRRTRRRGGGGSGGGAEEDEEEDELRNTPTVFR